MSGCDDETCHVKGTWRDDKLIVALGIVAVRTVFAAWEYHRQILVIAPPADDVHHRLCIVILHRQGFIKAQEQLLVAVLRMAADEQGGAGVFLDE